MYEMFLKDWATMNSTLGSLREDQIKDLINLEIQGKGRMAWLERMHQRYNKRRIERERAEILSGKLL